MGFCRLLVIADELQTHLTFIYCAVKLKVMDCLIWNNNSTFTLYDVFKPMLKFASYLVFVLFCLHVLSASNKQCRLL
jgi:hypothetical protein